MIVYGDEVVNFASLYLKARFNNNHAIGFKQNGEIQGAIVFDTFTHTIYGQLQGVELSVIVVDRRCINRYNLKHIFSYPFIRLGAKRLCIRTGRNEKKKRRLVERLGFKYEGISREAWPLGGDAAVYSMLPHECKWI